MYVFALVFVSVCVCVRACACASCSLITRYNSTYVRLHSPLITFKTHSTFQLTGWWRSLASDNTHRTLFYTQGTQSTSSGVKIQAEETSERRGKVGQVREMIRMIEKDLGDWSDGRRVRGKMERWDERERSERNVEWKWRWGMGRDNGRQERKGGRWGMRKRRNASPI